MAVVAQVGGDEAEVGRGGYRLEVGGKPGGAGRRAGGEAAGGGPQRDDVGVAELRVVDDRVEVDERVVTGGIAVARDRFFGEVGRADGGMAADSGLPGGDVAHVLHVALPGQVGLGELVGHRGHGGREDAARVGDLAVGGHGGAGREVGEDLAVGLVEGIGCLPRDQRDVVVVGEVPDPVVVGEQGTCAGRVPARYGSAVGVPNVASN